MVCVRRGMVGFMVCQGSSATAITSSLLSIIRTGGLSHLVPSSPRATEHHTVLLHSALHRRFLLRRTKVARRHGLPRPRLLPLLHCVPLQLGLRFTSFIGGMGVPAPAADTRHHSRRRSSGRQCPSRRACASDWGDNWFYSHWQWPHARCPTVLRSL